MASARAARRNCGWRRDAGKRRTSTSAPIPWAASRPSSSSIDRVEWPIVKISGSLDAGGAGDRDRDLDGHADVGLDAGHRLEGGGDLAGDADAGVAQVLDQLAAGLDQLAGGLHP